jgi:transcriptional regulator with XRE-family HTH domain
MNEEEFKLELADQIKIARLKTGKSLMNVLHDTGINISRIEQGESSIQLFTYYRLCKYLKISIEKILMQTDINLTRKYSGDI